MLSKDGIVGFGSISPIIRECDFSDRDLLILYSDGIKEHFNLLDYLALFTGETESITRGVLKEFGKKTDDACCIALKYIK